jgi:raffinose/stachyose/melibiose transport system substrate-binding protein
MKKKLCILVVAAMIIGLLAPAMTAFADDGSVYWLNFKPESDEVLQEVAAMYEEETGVKVKVVTAASGTYSQTLNSEMDKSAPPTLFIIGNQAGVKDWADYAVDLTDTPIANELNTDAYNLYSEDGKLVSIGYCYECYGIIVNPDLVEAAGYSMEDIKNFESLKKVAEDIHSRAEELGFDAFSACDMDSSSSWRFTGHLANLEYYYEERDDGGWTECPPALKGTYMENYKNLYDLCINNSTVDPKDLATGGHDSEAEFKDGKAAFFVNGSWEYAAVSEAVPNATMIPYYCGVEGEEKAGLNCGTENCWAINAKASEADQQATMDFLVCA